MRVVLYILFLLPVVSVGQGQWITIGDTTTSLTKSFEESVAYDCSIGNHNWSPWILMSRPPQIECLDCCHREIQPDWEEYWGETDSVYTLSGQDPIILGNGIEVISSEEQECAHAYVILATPDTGRDSIRQNITIVATLEWSEYIKITAHRECICLYCHHKTKCY